MSKSAIQALIDAAFHADIASSQIPSKLIQAAQAELDAGVRVKPLVWEEVGADVYEARVSTGIYAIDIKDGEMGYGYDLWMATDDKEDYSDYYHPTLNDAKAAAQAHYEQMIKGGNPMNKTIYINPEDVPMYDMRLALDAKFNKTEKPMIATEKLKADILKYASDDTQISVWDDDECIDIAEADAYFDLTEKRELDFAEKEFTYIEAELIGARVGQLALTRHELVDMVGEEMILKEEERIGEEETESWYNNN